MEDTAYPGETVAKHTDIEDKKQTIQIPEKPVKPGTATSESTTETLVSTTETPAPNTAVAGTYEEITEVMPAQETRTTVKTGDDSHIFLVLLIASTALLGIGMTIVGNRKKKK